MSKTITNPTLAALRAMMTAPPVNRVKVDSPPPRAPRAKKTLPPPTVDLRALTNTKPHVRIPYAGPAPKTPAAAAKLRRTAMQECECRMCALVLYPPQTFAEYEALGLRAPSIDRVREERALFEFIGPLTEAQSARAAEMGVGR